jgi:chromate reductase
MIAKRHEDVREVATLSLRDLPFYDGDLELSGGTESVRAARQLVADADAVLISTPSYNGAPSGVLKNALDWLSRPYDDSALADKIVATMSASPGGRGGLESQVLLRDLLNRCGCTVVEHEPLAIGDAVNLCAATGEITDPGVLAAIEALVEATVALVKDMDAKEDVVAA